jgi:hypothetical protein
MEAKFNSTTFNFVCFFPMSNQCADVHGLVHADPRWAQYAGEAA